ncbi:MAG: phosphate ABC transporter substrate-binding protein [Cellulosilyticaceae bacterium]
MKKFLTLIVAMTTLCSLAVGCGNKITQATNNTTITFNGASTLAPVVSKISEDFAAKYVTWDKVDSTLPAEKISINVTSGGSGQGVKAVIEKTSDLGMISRTVKDDEKAQIPNLQEFQLGIDALTIAVNPNNPILALKNDLTKDEIIGLFSGKYKYWNDLDASLPKEEVVVITRDIGGGAHEVFQSKIMGDTDVKADAIQAPSMGALVQKVMDNNFAIGYASYGVVNQNEGKIIPLKVDGIAATAENIINGSYIIQRPLILIVDGELSATEKAFVDYAKSEAGLAIVDSLGFIPQK